MKKNLIKKLVSLVATTTLAGSLLVGCGNAAQGSGDPAPAADPAAQTEDTTVADADTTGTEESGDEVEFKGTITVAASQTPHSEILAEAAKILKEQG